MAIDTMVSTLAQIESHSEQLAAAVKSLVEYRRSIDSASQLPVSPDADKELNKAKARETILASVAAIKTLLSGPADFLQHLTSQVEILASLQWLAEFQVLACIPLEGSVPIEDLADLVGVSESQLRRVIRLTATCGFLHEPELNFVAHTQLSAQFITDQCLLDATIFMAESVAPTALQMPSASQRFGSSRNPSESAYNLALNTTRPFHVVRQERSKLDRQWSAYLSHAAGLHQEEEVVDVFSRLNWSNLGNACIVEVGAQSTSMARCLAKRFPSLHLVIQINNPQSSTPNPDLMWQQNGMMVNRVWPGDSYEAQLEPGLTSSSSSDSSSNSARITVSYRAAGMPQPVKDAAVYIFHLSVASSTLPTEPGIRSELRDYLGVLRASGGVMLVLTTRLLPEPGSLSNPEVEAVARARDLSMLQLSNEGEMEMAELMSTIEKVKDGMGKLVVTNQLRSRNGLIIAIVIKLAPYITIYQPFSDLHVGSTIYIRTWDKVYSGRVARSQEAHQNTGPNYAGPKDVEIRNNDQLCSFDAYLDLVKERFGSVIFRFRIPRRRNKPVSGAE